MQHYSLLKHPQPLIALEAAGLVQDMTSLDLTVNATSFQGPFLILEGGREKDSVKKVAANDELWYTSFAEQENLSKRGGVQKLASNASHVPEIYGNGNVYY